MCKKPYFKIRSPGVFRMLSLLLLVCVFSPFAVTGEEATSSQHSGLQAVAAGSWYVSLDWDDNTEPDLAGYNVHRSTLSGSGYAKLNDTSPVGGSDYVDNGIEADTTYYYVVTAVDTSDNESSYSNEAWAYTGYTPTLFDFELGNEWNWYTTDNEVLNPAINTFEHMPGTTNWALGMESTDTVAENGQAPALAYGYWQSPRVTANDRIPYISGKLYKVTWSLVADKAAAADQCGLRFRVSTGSDSCGGDMVLQEFQGSKIAITTDAEHPTELYQYWYPPQWVVDANVALYPDQAGLFLAAEMFDNVAATTGKYWIPEVVVHPITPPASTSPVFTAPPFAESSWRDTTRTDNVNSSFHESNGLTIEFPAITGTTPTMRLRYWEYIDPSAQIPLEGNTLYRATFIITSSGDTPPVFRQRLIVRNLYLGTENVITPTIPWGPTFDYAIPGSTPREMVCYLPVQDQYLPWDDLLFSMDVYGPVGASDLYNGTYHLTSVAVEKFTPLP